MSRKPKQTSRVFALMLLKGITYEGIAEDLGVSWKTVAVVASGHEKSRRIQEAIAKELGMQINELWPEKEKPEAVNE